MEFLRALVAMVLVGSVLAAPAHGQIDNPDESTPTTLYFHIWDPFNKFVVNTQPYNATFYEVGGVNFPTVEANGDDFNTMYGYSTAGPVEYEFIEAGRPRIHPERGIAADIQIDDAVQPMGYLYVDARGIFGGDDSPATLPEMTFRITMREGDDPGSNLDEGALIMQGSTTVTLFDARVCPWHTVVGPTLVNGGYLGLCDAARFDLNDFGGYSSFPTEDPVTGNPIIYPDAQNIHAIPIPMDLSSNIIPKSEAYNLRVDYYQEVAPLCGEDECAQGNLRWILDESHLPRLEMNLKNPVYVEFLHPQVAAGTLLIHSGVNSPWGTYDVDVENMKITVDGPSTPINLDRVVAQNAHVHGLHDKAAEITYLWKFRDEGADEGDYTISIEVPNVAGTAVAKATAGFTIEGREAFGVDTEGEIVPETVEVDSKDSPVGGLLAALALLGSAFLLRRRSL